MRRNFLILISLSIGYNLFSQTVMPENTLKKWHKVASKYYRMDNFKEALKYSDSLLIAQPQDCRYIGLKGAILNSMKNYDESEKILIQGLKFGCDSIKIYLILANGQSSQNNYSKALEYNWAAIKIRPDSAELYIKRATIYSIIGDKENDMRNLQKAKSLGSKRAAELLEILEHPR